MAQMCAKNRHKPNARLTEILILKKKTVFSFQFFASQIKDINKAFDCVSHDILLSKLNFCYAWKWFITHVSNTTQIEK